MRAAGAALAVAALLASLITSARAQELKPISPFAATEAAPPSAFAQRPVAAPFQSRGPLGGVFAWVLDKQQTLQRTLAMSVKGLKTDNPDGRRSDACRALVPLRHPACGRARARQDHHLFLCRRQRGDGAARGDHLVHRRGAPGADRCRSGRRCCCSGSTQPGSRSMPGRTGSKA